MPGTRVVVYERVGTCPCLVIVVVGFNLRALPAPMGGYRATPHQIRGPTGW